MIKIKKYQQDEDGRPIVLRDGRKIELDPPFCEVCGTHMGEEYCLEDGKFENPYGYEDYGENTCPNPKCRQEYNYI